MLHLSKLFACKVVAPVSVAWGATSQGLYQKLVSPETGPGEVAALANDLMPFLATTSELTLPQKFHLLETLSSRAIRHEGVLQKCIWDILKWDLQPPHGERLFNRQLALCTGATFDIMTRMGFKNDQQMLALALGRSIELAPMMSLGSVEKVYQALSGLDITYFSLASVAMHETDVNADFTVRDTLTDPDGENRTLSALANQPNLIDVVCTELEHRLGELSALVPAALVAPTDARRAGGGPFVSPPRDAGAIHALSSLLFTDTDGGAPPPAGDRLVEAQVRLLASLHNITHALSRVGAASPDIFASLGGLFDLALPPRRRPSSRPPQLSGAAQARVAALLVGSLRDAARIEERVVDSMNHLDSFEFTELRTGLTAGLAARLNAIPALGRVFQRDPQLVLTTRGLFEEMPALAETCPQLWDQVRCVRVAHRHVVAARTAGRPPLARMGGKLFDKKFAVKVKPVSEDLSGAERFVPPQFKTWRTPVHAPRGGHVQSSRGPGRAVKFGTRRISKNYLKSKRTKYGQSI